MARSVVLDHLYRDSKTSFFPKRARLFTTTCTRANKAAGYRPFVFVLFVFVSLEEDKEDKDEKEGFGVSLGVVRV